MTGMAMKRKASVRDEFVLNEKAGLSRTFAATQERQEAKREAVTKGVCGIFKGFAEAELLLDGFDDEDDSENIFYANLSKRRDVGCAIMVERIVRLELGALD